MAISNLVLSGDDLKEKGKTLNNKLIDEFKRCVLFTIRTNPQRHLKAYNTWSFFFFKIQSNLYKWSNKSKRFLLKMESDEETANAIRKREKDPCG